MVFCPYVCLLARLALFLFLARYVPISVTER